MIHADDSSVKGGAWYPLTVKKIVRAMEIALENHVPMVHLCDSAGGQHPCDVIRVGQSPGSDDRDIRIDAYRLE